MFDEILHRMQAKVQALDYVMTVHANEEMDSDSLSIFDIEQVILTGQIIERQRDRHTREWKYVIKGQTQDSVDVVVVAKLSPTTTVIIITVYAE